MNLNETKVGILIRFVGNLHYKPKKKETVKINGENFLCVSVFVCLFRHSKSIGKKIEANISNTLQKIIDFEIE